MLKAELTQAVDNCRNQTKEALQTVYNALNHGQRKQLVNDKQVKALFDLYDIELW